MNLTESHETEYSCTCNTGTLGMKESFLQSLHHVVSKLKRDLADAPKLEGYNLDIKDAEHCIPDSLHTLLNWLLSDADCMDTDIEIDR
jgi:hypothetical protein